MRVELLSIVTAAGSFRGRNPALSALLFAALLMVSGGNALAQGSVAADKAALEALYDATDGPNWTTSTNWKTEGELSTWHGVFTAADGRVTQLYLFSNELSGEIPEELGNLSNLEELYLFNNELTGEIPEELGSLTHLEELFLHGNRLSEEIPEELGDLSNLLYLYLNNNQLTGTIPEELGDLSNLRRLDLFNNELTGRSRRNWGTCPTSGDWISPGTP